MFTQNGKKGGGKTGILTAQNSQKFKEKFALCITNLTCDDDNSDKKSIFLLEFLTVWGSQNSCFAPPFFPFWVNPPPTNVADGLLYQSANRPIPTATVP